MDRIRGFWTVSGGFGPDPGVLDRIRGFWSNTGVMLGSWGFGPDPGFLVGSGGFGTVRGFLSNPGGFGPDLGVYDWIRVFWSYPGVSDRIRFPSEDSG